MTQIVRCVHYIYLRVYLQIFKSNLYSTQSVKRDFCRKLYEFYVILNKVSMICNNRYECFSTVTYELRSENIKQMF